MLLKSSPDRYGAVAVSLHWLTVVLILILLWSGFLAGEAEGVRKAVFLRAHVPLGVTVLLLTLFRVVWWRRFDPLPHAAAGVPVWQERLARGVHVTLYVVLFAMAASGIAMMVLSGAAPALFGGGAAALPDFADYSPRAPHGVGAFALIGLLAADAGAALYHHFVRRDAVLRRMWYGTR